MSDDTKNFTNLTPHGELQKVSDNVYIVEGSFNLMPGTRIPRTMCIVKRGASLTVLNSIRVNELVQAQIKELGTVENLVRLANSHGCDDAWYLSQADKPKYWSLPGATPLPGAPAQETLGEKDGESPLKDAKVMIIENTKTPEALMLIPDNGGTLITADVLQNSTNMEHANFLGKAANRLLGFNKPCTCVPMYPKLQGVKDKDLWPNYERILSLEFDTLVTGHGPAKVGGVKEALENNLKDVFADKMKKEEPKTEEASS